MSTLQNYRAEESGTKFIEGPSLKKRKISTSKFIPEDIVPCDPILECCVCIMSDIDGLAILVDNERQIQQNGFHPFATLSDCDEDIPLEGTIFKSCCGVHSICFNCLKTIAINFDNHPIGINYPLIKCPYPFNGDTGCISPIGIPNYFSHSDIKKILNNNEFQMYLNHSERYQFPGYEIVKCPRPIILNDDGIGICGAWILVPIDLIKKTSPGNLILECDQNPDCYRRSCYHCNSLIKHHGLERGARDDGLAGTVQGAGIFCEYCITSKENTNPKALNKYFYRSDKCLKDGKSLFFRNEELTSDIVMPQLREIAESEELFTRCFECLTIIYKTEQCNTITHCGIERCYVCGRSGSCEQDLGDHWDVTGMRGCPRFDHSNFWNEWGDCEFKCREGYCYGDDIGRCNIVAHKFGINEMNNIRKKAHIYHCIKSLLPELRDIIQYKAMNIESLHNYLPKYMCSEYRAFLADVMFNKKVQAQYVLSESIDNIKEELYSIHNEDDSSEESDSSLSELLIEVTSSSSESESSFSSLSNQRIRECQNLINKLSNINFNELDYGLEQE